MYIYLYIYLLFGTNYYNLHFMHDILVKNDCDSSFQGIHYISANRNNISLFAVGFCTSMPTDLCFSLHFLCFHFNCIDSTKDRKFRWLI